MNNLPRFPEIISQDETNLFHRGETLLYSDSGTTSLARVQDVFINKERIVKLKLLFPSGKEVTTTQQSVRSPDNADLGWVPTSVPDFRANSRLLSDDVLKRLASPQILSPM